MTSEKMTHTPGPWYVVKMPGWNGTVIGRRPQADAERTAGDAPIACLVQGQAHWQSKYPVEANARLIAAAPDLLKALEEIAHHPESKGPTKEDQSSYAVGWAFWNVRNIARAAIASAKA